MLNIINYQRRANQNYNEESPHTGQSGHSAINTTEDVERKEPSHPVDGNINWLSSSGEEYGGSLKN